MQTKGVLCFYSQNAHFNKLAREEILLVTGGGCDETLPPRLDVSKPQMRILLITVSSKDWSD